VNRTPNSEFVGRGGTTQTGSASFDTNLVELKVVVDPKEIVQTNSASFYTTDAEYYGYYM